MNQSKRLHRADPARTGPIRNFSNLYRQPDAAETHGNVDPQGGANPGEQAAGADPITRGVDAAYQVIEKYIAAGRRAAQQISTQPYIPRFAGEGLQELVQQILRFQSEMAPLWMEMIGSVAKGGPGATSPVSRNGAHANGAARPQSHPVAIELRAKRPVVATFEKRGEARAADLATAGLHALEADKPALTDIALLPDDSGRWARVCISIPDQQAPGRYSGVVVDRATGEVRGVLGVLIE